MESREMAILAARALEGKKGKNIKVIKVEDLTLVTDYFVVCTGGSTPHCQALSTEVEDKLAEKGVFFAHKEGALEARWILLDFSQVIVHIFQEDDRKFYNLERLWADAPCLLDTEVFGDKKEEA